MWHAMWILVVACMRPALEEPATLVHLRFEDRRTDPGEYVVVNDVVGWGGVTLGNSGSALLDGQAAAGIDLGRQRQVAVESFTVEAFVKVAEQLRYAAIAADWNEQVDDRSWAFVLTPRGSLRFDVSPDGRFHGGNKLETAPRLIKPNVWYHVAAVSDGNTSRIFVNGRQVADGTREAAGIYSDDSAHLRIGNVDLYATDGPRPWHGWIDEVRISTEALQAKDFIRTRESMPEVSGGAPSQYTMPFTAQSREEMVVWQQQARQRMLDLVAAQQPRRPLDEVPLDFQLGAAQSRDGYTRYPASFRGDDGMSRLDCYLAIPEGKGPFPAILALHGHGGSRDAVFDSGTVYHSFADRFARGGYVVIAPSFPHRQYCATMLWDLIRLVDILCEQDQVDKDRIGVAGLSMGGEWAMWSAACDTRVKAAVISGWMCTTEGVFSVPNCECWELPGFVELMDVCEVHLLIAPRPTLFESAEHDNCFPIAFTRQGFRRIRAGYGLLGAEEQVQQDVWSAGHQWHGELAFPFIDSVLGGHAAKLHESVLRNKGAVPDTVAVDRAVFLAKSTM